ncbi:MAG: hypothetical protein P1U82_24335 [Verrucomicrobiales bacterium]|nr:hypothetical protein [Verrucomicrobiales bacterium]
MKRIAITSVVLVTLLVGVIAAYLGSVRPWQSKILAHGHSPEGREYCLVQTYRDLVEPYQVSFYIRDANGIWRWNYLGHQENGWKSGTVTFSDGSALIERNGAMLKEIEIPNESVDLAGVLPGYSHQYLGSELTTDDVFAFHNQRYND